MQYADSFVILDFDNLSLQWHSLIVWLKKKKTFFFPLEHKFQIGESYCLGLERIWVMLPSSHVGKIVLSGWTHMNSTIKLASA